MAYLLYRHIKAKRTATASAGSGSAQEKPAKPVKLCDHQRDISLDTLGMPTDLSDFSNSPQLKGDGVKELAVDKPQAAAGGMGPCQQCKQEKRAARTYRWKLIAGLFLPFTVQALDTTIVAGALPFIASDFRMSWCLVPQDFIADGPQMSFLS
jgi:hypothetical protein